MRKVREQVTNRSSTRSLSRTTKRPERLEQRAVKDDRVWKKSDVYFTDSIGPISDQLVVFNRSIHRLR
jgi:hypothetical protein